MKATSMNEGERARFESKIHHEPMSGCWLWGGTTDRDGYGFFKMRGRMERPHRLAWALSNGKQIPPGGHICHRCDVPACVNPSHLWLGDNRLNRQDMVAKGRQAQGIRSGRHTHPECGPRGERHGMAKLSDDEIRALLAMRARGHKYREVGAAFGVSASYVCALVRGRANRGRQCV